MSVYAANCIGLDWRRAFFDPSEPPEASHQRSRTIFKDHPIQSNHIQSYPILSYPIQNYIAKGLSNSHAAVKPCINNHPLGELCEHSRVLFLRKVTDEANCFKVCQVCTGGHACLHEALPCHARPAAA